MIGEKMMTLYPVLYDANKSNLLVLLENQLSFGSLTGMYDLDDLVVR